MPQERKGQSCWKAHIHANIVKLNPFCSVCAVPLLHILKQLQEKEPIRKAVCPKPHACFPAMLGNPRKAISSSHKPSFFEENYVWNKRCFSDAAVWYLRKVFVRWVSFAAQLKNQSRKVCPPPFPHRGISEKVEVLFPWHKSHLCSGSQRMRQLYTSGNAPVGTVTAVRSCFPGWSHPGQISLHFGGR